VFTHSLTHLLTSLAHSRTHLLNLHSFCSLTSLIHFLKVYHRGESFGELALMYNSKRAATIKVGMCVCMYVCMYACMCMYVCVCMYVYVRVCMCMYVCMYVFVCVNRLHIEPL